MNLTADADARVDEDVDTGAVANRSGSRLQLSHLFLQLLPEICLQKVGVARAVCPPRVDEKHALEWNPGRGAIH